MVAWNYSFKAFHSTQNRSLTVDNGNCNCIYHYTTSYYIILFTLHSIIWYVESCTWLYTTIHIQRKRSTVARSPSSAWMPVTAWMGMQFLMKELVHCSRPWVQLYCQLLTSDVGWLDAAKDGSNFGWWRMDTGWKTNGDCKIGVLAERVGGLTFSTICIKCGPGEEHV